MEVTPESILELVAGGESDHVEFKTQLPPEDIVARELVAFANAEGGLLLIGVTDKGQIAGLSKEEVKRAIDRLSQLTASLLPYPARVATIEVEGKNIVYVYVDKAPEQFRPITTSRGAYYMREKKAALVQGLSGMSEFYLSRFKEVPTEQPTSSPNGRLNVFVAMSFREEEEPALVDYFRAMRRASDSTGLPIDLVRIDLEEGDYEISQEIMEKIDECHVVIADFTLSPRNVYFELGYARGKNRRTIQTARKGTRLEFDVRNWRTLFYRNATELEEKFAPALKAAYSDIFGD